MTNIFLEHGKFYCTHHGNFNCTHHNIFILNITICMFFGKLFWTMANSLFTPWQFYSTNHGKQNWIAWQIIIEYTITNLFWTFHGNYLTFSHFPFNLVRHYLFMKHFFGLNKAMWWQKKFNMLFQKQFLLLICHDLLEDANAIL